MTDDTAAEPPGPEYRLVMPFVTTRGNGGHHDDQSYVAGWEMAKLDSRCELTAHYDLGGFCLMVRAENAVQADLIAMKHRMVMVCEGEGPDGWVHLHFNWPDDNNDDD